MYLKQYSYSVDSSLFSSGSKAVALSLIDVSLITITHFQHLPLPTQSSNTLLKNPFGLLSKNFQMYASTIFATIIAVAMAVSTGSGDDNQAPSVGDVCSNGTVHCCIPDAANKAVSGTLSNIALSNLLGECNDITAAVEDGVSIQNTCSMGAICCEKQYQNGLDIVSCTLINA